MEPEPKQPEPAWEQKVVLVDNTLCLRGIPHAFGGAIALNYHREPRATLDIDINIFLPPEDQAGVLTTLGELYDLGDRGGLARQLADQGQARTLWHQTYVDLFFTNTPFHEAMKDRTKVEIFGDTEIPVLSIEDLLVCKAVFNRQKDWVDIEAVLRTEGVALDHAYIDEWLGEFFEADAVEVERLAGVRRQIAGSG